MAQHLDPCILSRMYVSVSANVWRHLIAPADRSDRRRLTAHVYERVTAVGTQTAPAATAMAAIGIVEQRVGQAAPDDLVTALATRDAPGCGAGLASLGAAAAGPVSAETPSARGPERMLPGLSLHGEEQAAR